mgnify:CR=1 FL=1
MEMLNNYLTIIAIGAIIIGMVTIAVCIVDTE